MQPDTWSRAVLWNLYESLKYVVQRFWCDQWTSDKPILITCAIYNLTALNPEKVGG